MVIKSNFQDITVPETGIIQFLFANPHNVPSDRKILIDVTNKNSLTYGELRDQVLSFAAGLQDKFNFQKNDSTCIFSPNQIDYSITLLGTVAAGGAASPANPNYTAGELAYQLETTGAKVLIAHPVNVQVALEAAKLAGLPKSSILIFGDQPVNDILPYKQVLLGARKVVPVELSPQEVEDTVAYLCFSSGTTGRSKGVMTTHKNMVSNILQYCALDQPYLNGEKDRALGVLPFFHIFGLTIKIHVALYLGVPVYVMPKFDLPLFCETVQNEKITFSCLVPPIIILLAKHPLIDQYNLESLKLVISGAAPLGADISEQVKKRLPTMTIKQGYGLTETSPCAIIEPTNRVIPGSTGILLANMTAKIVDESGKEVAVGERGELWLKGPNIMKGYINNPEATADCIDNEKYFHTGDVAVQDKDGHFYIVDRIKELIKYKGFQVPPAELEAHLLNSPLVADCAVIGIYDPEQATELPRGYVVVKPDVPATDETAKTIMKFIADQVVYYKQLRSVVFIDEIPKSASGKILRRILRDAAAEEQKQAKQVSRI